MSKAEPILELEDVSAMVGAETIDAVSLVVRRGEAVALVGANGSGKSLAIRVAAGLETPVEGRVRLLGMDPYQLSTDEYIRLRPRVGVVFDRPALLSNMSVFNNVAFPLRYHSLLPEADIMIRVTNALKALGVEALRNVFPADLALGDARLVALARAQVIDPQILFLDEMLIGLDARGLSRLRDFFEQTRKRGGPTVVAAANAPSPLLELMDRLFFFREGHLVASGKPTEIATIDEPAVQEMLRL